MNLSPNTGDKLKVVSPDCCIARTLCQSPVGALRKGLFKLQSVNEVLFFGKGLWTLRAAILEQWEITLLIPHFKWHLCKGFPSTHLNVFVLTLHVFISVITKVWCHTLSLKFSIKCFARPWGLYSAVQILASTTQVFFPNLRILAFSLPEPQAIVDTAYITIQQQLVQSWKIV